MTKLQRMKEDHYGRRTEYDEYEVGAPLGPGEWMVSQRDLDNYGLQTGDFTEYYSVGSPFGGTVAPPLISYRPVRVLFKRHYMLRGLLAGYAHQQFDVIRPNVLYTLEGEISAKYIKRDREWVEYEVRCIAPDGTLVFRDVRRHVMHFIRRSEAADEGRVLKEVEGHDARQSDGQPVEEVFPYAPPFLNRDEWRTPDNPDNVSIWTGSWADANVPLGTELPPVSLQNHWRYSRDFYELSYHARGLDMEPQIVRAWNIHTHQGVSEREGQSQPNAGGPQVISTMHRMMAYVGGYEWPRTASWDVRYLKQVPLNDFITAKGRVKGKALEGSSVRLACEVWVENHAGEKVIAGEASVLLPSR